MRHIDRYEETKKMADSEKVARDANEIPSAVMRRLIEEVRIEKLTPISGYNRTHNRHNRGR